jgi:hypothetical protein
MQGSSMLEATTGVFPTWRELWFHLEGIPDLLTQVDKILTRRSDDSQQMPEAAEDVLHPAVQALRLWANGQPPADVGKHPKILRLIHAAVAPALAKAAWTRWLLLERALQDASATGDLLFAATVLRTMCEDVLRLHALDLGSDELVRLAASPHPADQARFQTFLAVGWTSLAELPREMVLEGEGWPRLDSIADSLPHVKASEDALNAYVHPNYGSHIAALYPEGAEARLQPICCLRLYLPCMMHSSNCHGPRETLPGRPRLSASTLPGLELSRNYALECFLSSNAARATPPSPKSSNRVSWSSGSPKRRARRQ